MSTSFVRRAAQAATLVALVATATHAQPQPPAGQPPAGGGRGMGGARQMQMMMEGITLSAMQQTKVDSITKAYQAKMPAMTPGTPPSDEDRQTRMKMTNERNAAIKAVLTSDQQKTWDANMEKMRANMPQRPGAL